MDYCPACREQAQRTTVCPTVVWLTLRVTLTLALMAAGPLPVGSYPHGSPKEACRDMRPRHGASEPKPSVTSPYELTLAPGVQTYSPHRKVKVRIEGTPFVGFMLQARRADSPHTNPVGRFDLPPAYSKHLRCSHHGDTVTHANKAHKWNMEFSWRPPSHNEGPIHFIATVVLRFDTYWMNVTSDILVPEGYPEPVVTSTTVPTTAVLKTSTSGTSARTVATSSEMPTSTKAGTMTLEVSTTTPMLSPELDDIESTTMTSRPIIIDEDHFPLISSAPGRLRPDAGVLLFSLLLISCSIRWLFTATAGPRQTS